MKKNICIYFVLTLLCFPLLAQQVEEPQILLKHLRGQIYHVSGTVGGNIVAHIGEDGVLLIDAGSVAAHQPLIKKAIATITDKPVKWLINTHWHSDHTAGNVPWGSEGIKILAHEKVADRLRTQQYIEFMDRTVKPLDKDGIPDKTFSKSKILRFNKEKIDILHIAAGHTDGDAVIVFNNANIIHMGDLYFNGLYPYIGISSGGSIGGMIKVINWTLKEMNEEAIVIPGHGPVSTKAELHTYVNMLIKTRNNILPMVKAGNTLEEIQAARPTKEFDEAWGKLWLSGDEFTRLIYMDLIRSAK
ncbi:MBL fold metallo-hydrolase [bacterium]|nr:MBL fold metallo-hydrolase [bacterium]